MLNDRDYMHQRYGASTASGQNLVFVLIALNVVIFLMQKVTSDAFVPFFYLEPFLVLHRLQFWRLLSHAFLHANLSHLFFNMYSIWLFGRLVIQRIGGTRFLFLYLLSAILGGFCWVVCNLGQPVVCIGASGACFGVMVAAAMAYPQARFLLLFPPIPLKLWVLVLGYCILEILMLAQTSSNVAHLAHLGGALGGYVFMRFLGWTAYVPDFLRRLFGRRPDTRGPSSSSSSQWRGGASAEPTGPEIDQVLDRISQVGYSNLTEEEREVLRRASDQLRARQNGE